MASRLFHLLSRSSGGNLLNKSIYDFHPRNLAVLHAAAFHARALRSASYSDHRALHFVNKQQIVNKHSTVNNGKENNSSHQSNDSLARSRSSTRFLISSRFYHQFAETKERKVKFRKKDEEVNGNLKKTYHKMAEANNMHTDIKQDVVDIALNAIETVTPNQMIANAITVEDGQLLVKDQKYGLRHNVYVAAFGKAVLGMIRAVEDVLGAHIVRGVASVPVGIQTTLKNNNLHHMLPTTESKVEIYEGAKLNLPDEAAAETSKKICQMVESLSHGDILLVLISGGGSALLTLPQPPITLDDIITVTKEMGQRGATITQLNMLRRHLSTVKGGRLALKAAPAQVVSLILSDVLGDPLEAIASGPTVPDTTTAQCCLDILSEFGLDPNSTQLEGTTTTTTTTTTALKIVNFLKAKREAELQDYDSAAAGFRAENRADKMAAKFAHVQNVIVGNNEMVVQQAILRASTLGYRTLTLSTKLSGVARDRGVDAANMALYACSLLHRNISEPNKSLVRLEIDLVSKGLGKDVATKLSRVAAAARNSGGGLCLLTAGETTVEVKGKGKGGRNQEFALAAGQTLHQLAYGNVMLNNYDIVILSIGTDGQDGPTDAAGAFADPQMVADSRCPADVIQRFLDDNDSYTFFARALNGAYHVKTGLTGTNVMDLQLILIKARKTSPPTTTEKNVGAKRDFDQILE